MAAEIVAFLAGACLAVPVLALAARTRAGQRLCGKARAGTPIAGVPGLFTEEHDQSEIFQTLLAKISQGIMMVDADDRVVVCNDQAIALLGLPRALIDSRPSFKQVAEYQYLAGEFAHLPCGLREAVDRAEVPKTETVYERERPNGVILEIRSVPLAGGGMVRTYTDVTLNRRQAMHIRQTQRLESIGKLTGGIAHDFNNLLAVINLNAEALADLADGQSEPSELIQVILTAVRSGSALTQRLLAYSRKQTLRPQPIDLGRYLVDQIELVRRAIGSSITVQTDIEENLPSVRVDASQVGDALLNVAVNARDAMAGGGILSIQLKRGETAPQAWEVSGVHEPGSFVVLSVTDTGCGMPPEVIAQATEPFYTTKPVGEGSGLGLSMVEGFVGQSGGYLSINSAVNAGTTISIYLPCTEGEPPFATLAVTNVPLSVNRERVLVVDDNDVLRASVAQMLARLGYEVAEAGNGPEALLRLVRSGPYGLLLTDLAMPGGTSGTDLAAHAQTRWPGMPVLFMSGIAPPDTAMRMLQKPFSRQELAEAVRAAMDRVEA